MLRAAVVASRPRNGVRLVYDDELGGVVQEALSIPIRLDEIDADDHVAIVLVEGDIATRKPALQSPNPRRLDDCRIDIELRSQLLFPLLAQVRSTENADAAHSSPVQQFAGDHGCLDGLAHANIVSDEQTHRV